MKKIIRYNIDIPNVYYSFDINSNIIPPDGTVINFPFELIKDIKIKNDIEDYVEDNVLISKIFSFTYIGDNLIISISLLTEDEYKIQKNEEFK